jgi:hypothetical protein
MGSGEKTARPIPASAHIGAGSAHLITVDPIDQPYAVTGV